MPIGVDSMLFSQLAKDSIDQKLIILMVGLPARGKSYIAKKLMRWLSWMGYSSKVFNVGNHRRVVGGNHNFQFFDHHDAEKSNLRHKLAMDVLEECIYWLKHQGGSVGIHDATNTTLERREMLLTRLQQEPDIQYIFIESVCRDEQVLASNIKMKLKSPDYINMDPEAATKDFMARLKNYEAAYQPIREEEEGFPYIQVVDVGRKVICNRISGYLPGQILFYLTNVHIQPRTIWLSRHGESEDNLQNRIGGDSPLTNRGRQYAQVLANFIREQDIKDLTVWTSTLRRAMETCKPMESSYKITKMRILNEIYGGCCEGRTYEEIDKEFPEIAQARSENKLTFRYPNGGESYLDVIERLKPSIIELERQRSSILVVSHRAIIRTIYAYFMDFPLEKLPHKDIPLNTVIKLTPTPYGCEEQIFDLNHLVQ